MEGLISFVIMAMLHIAMIFFDPFLLALKGLWSFWKFFDPNGPPDQYGFGECECKNWNDAASDAAELTRED